MQVWSQRSYPAQLEIWQNSGYAYILQRSVLRFDVAYSDSKMLHARTSGAYQNLAILTAGCKRFEEFLRLSVSSNAKISLLCQGSSTPTCADLSWRLCFCKSGIFPKAARQGDKDVSSGLA